MKDTRLIMGMPIAIELARVRDEDALNAAFAFFTEVDERFSTYKETSEVSRLNRGELAPAEASPELASVLALGARTKEETEGYFDMRRPDGILDPSGIVKGWAIYEAARLLTARGIGDFCIDAGGDIATAGMNEEGREWSVGIRNPFERSEIVKVVYPKGQGVATSGSYIRGAHIYDPHNPSQPLEDIVSLTVIAPDVLEADRFATAAFAMGHTGIGFIERRTGLEGYAIDRDGIATMTTGFLPYAA